jgi:hypothetical protein
MQIAKINKHGNPIIPNSYRAALYRIAVYSWAIYTRKKLLIHTLELVTSEKRSFVFCITAASGLLVALLSVSLNQQTYSQMMNPNMMGNRGWMMNPNNPNMMTFSNGSWMMNPFLASQNVTGSIKLMPKVLDAITSQIKVSINEAISSAEKKVGNNSRAVAGHLDVANGYLTYSIWIISPDSNIHKIVVDAGNGKILLSKTLSLQNMTHMMGPMMAPMMAPMMGPMMGPMMMNPNMMGPMLGLR